MGKIVSDKPSEWSLDILRSIYDEFSLVYGDYPNYTFYINKKVTETCIGNGYSDRIKYYLGSYYIGYPGKEYEVYLSGLDDDCYDNDKLGYFEFSTGMREHYDTFKKFPLVRVKTRNYRILSKIIDAELLACKIFNSRVGVLLHIELYPEFVSTFSKEIKQMEPQQMLDVKIPIRRIRINQEISLNSE